MDKVVELFAEEVKKSGFFGEWSLAVECGLGPEMSATMLMEYLRSPEDPQRQAFTKLLGYMRTRPWDKFLGAIFDLLTPEELQRFQKPGASEFYSKLGLLCSFQIEDYWKELSAQKNQEALEILGAVEKMSVSALDDKIRSIVREIVPEYIDFSLGSSMDGFKEELRKMLDDHLGGDEWKKKGDGPEN